MDFLNDPRFKGIEKFEHKIWLSSPTMHGDEQRWVDEAIQTNWVSTVGENINEVETQMAEYLGCKYAVGLSCGTAALHMATKLAGERLYGQARPNEGTLKGQKVFCSDVTFGASANPVAYEDGEAVFIDTEYDNWNMSPEALEKAFELYPDVKLVVVAHLYGTPGKIEEIKSICDKHGALIVEDAAESLGATYKGVQTGTFGDYNAISFNGNKIITTSGGGMLYCRDEEPIKKSRFLATQAREPERHYEHKEIGYNYRMSNVVAGIGRGQLKHLDEHVSLKRDIYMQYRDAFADLEEVRMNPYPAVSEPNFWLSCMTIDEQSAVKPIDIMLALEKENIETRPIWKPMHMQPVFSDCDLISVSDEPVSEDIFARGLCLPSDIKNTAEDMDKIISMVRSAFRA